MDRFWGESACVHVMPKEKFTKGFVDFTNDAFPGLDIWFIVYGPKTVGYVQPIGDNVLFVENVGSIAKDPVCNELLADSKLIILNWVNWRFAAELYRYHKKTLFLFWGLDLENAVTASFPRRLGRAFLLRQARGFITLIPQDRAKAETLSIKHGTWHLGMIIGSTRASVNSSKNQLCLDKQRSPVRVLVGNSATPSNNHRAVFEMLSAYKDEAVEFLVPLSYGDDMYREEVLRLGNEILGRAFHPILGYMDKEAYQELLSTVSVGVFNQHRQQGLGNITMLMRTGGKVYVSKDGPMWDHFKSHGEAVYATEDIKGLSFGDFTAYSKEAAMLNAKAKDVAAYYDEGCKRWSQIYSDHGVGRVR